MKHRNGINVKILCSLYDVGVVQDFTYVIRDGMFTETMEGLILSLLSPHFNLSHHLLL